MGTTRPSRSTVGHHVHWGALTGTYNNLVVTGPCTVGEEVTVNGNVSVKNGGVLAFGHPNEGCGPDVQATSVINGNVVARGALSVKILCSTVNGNVLSTGGGYTAQPDCLINDGINPALKDNIVAGSITVQGWSGCWMGVICNQVGSNVTLRGNTAVAYEPGTITSDGMEIVTNTISGNLNCRGRTMSCGSRNLGVRSCPRGCRCRHTSGMSERVTIPTGDGDMPAHLWLPPGGTGPGIALMQEIFGVSAYIQRRGRQLAALGYVVLAPAIYWRLGPAAAEPIEGPSALQEGMARAGGLDWEAAVTDGVATVSALRRRDDVSGGVGLIGFCFGGGLAYNVAAALESQEGGQPVDALVSYYGSALPGLVDHLEVTAPSLHHFGRADEFIAAEDVAHVEDVVTRQPETTFVTYEGANHAFDNDDGPWFQAEASGLAWTRTEEFLAHRLPPASS